MTEVVKRLVSLFTEKPYIPNMGAGKIAKWQKCSISEVKEAKKIYYNSRITHNPNIQKEVKILILDIETTPLEAYVWQTQVWKARISDDNVITQWFMLCWSAKWLGEDDIMSMRLTGNEALKEDDSRIVRGIWELLDQADIVIAHNGDMFDIPNLNTRFIINGLPPTSPYKTIDTLKIARKQFGFTHNSLNALGRVFGLGEKIETDFNLWRKAKHGNDEALIEMEIYNREDVNLLERVYLKLRPFIKNHPNLGVYTMCEDNQCGHCASIDLTFSGYVYTNTGKYATYRCNKCGAVSRVRKSSLQKEKRENLLTTLN